MDIVTLGAALNGSAEYVNSHFVGGSNIQIVDNPDGTQTINASGEVSSEDTVARAEIAEMKDGTTIDSFGDVETALATKANTSTTYTKTEVDTALDDKVDKVSGKGLSTNDYTTAEKTKLAGIAEGAEVNEIESIKVNNTTINPDANKVVNITVPTTAADVSALPDTTKYAAALSLTINSSTFVMTGQLKDQNGDNLGTAQTIDLPLESVVVNGSYNNTTKKVVLTLQNGNIIEFSVADLVAGLQTELSASNKLNPAYINYDSTHRAVSDTEKSTWNGKQDALTTSQLAAANSGINSEKVAQYDSTTELEAEDRAALVEIVDSGAKNHINNTLTSGTTPSGNISYTVNTDKSITIIGGTATANADIVIPFSVNTSGTYVLTGGAAGGGSTTYKAQIALYPSMEGVAEVYGNTFKEVALTAGIDYAFRFRVYSGKNVPDCTIYPMVCTKAAWDISQTYQPYRPSYQELYEQTETNENNILIEDISDKITAASGYTINSLTKLYKQNNRVFGQVVISKDTGSFGGAQELIASFNRGYRPKDIQIQGCFFGSTAYNTEYTGYTYIQLATASSNAGGITIKGYQTNTGTVVNIHVDFVI